MKEKREKVDTELLSLKLVQKLQRTKEYKQAQHIMLFYPLKEEINLLNLLKDEGKSFYLPKIEGKDLLCCPYKSGDELCTSCFNTKEPYSEPVEKSLIDLVIIPALAVDKNKYRLGYGGGFYDRFLENLETIKIVCLPKEFVVETVYPEIHDIPVDIIITA